MTKREWQVGVFWHWGEKGASIWQRGSMVSTQPQNQSKLALSYF